ncbi:MAG: hypothetical protein WCQ23_05240 [Candidatus Methanomethylophilaceae archaeon]|jgi:shikimate kinase
MSDNSDAVIPPINNIPLSSLKIPELTITPKAYQRKITDTLADLNGVSAFCYLDNETFQEIKRSEEGVVASGGMVYENRALDDCYLKDVLMCIFCKGLVEEQKEISMVMMDDFGNITGNDVPPCLRSEYQGRKDLIWISDNFVIYTRAKQLSESRIVLLSRKFYALESVEGVSDPICFYPNVTSDRILKERFMDTYDPQMCTMIIGFNYSR